MMSDAIHFSSKFHYTSYFPPQRLYVRSMSSFKGQDQQSKYRKMSCMDQRQAAFDSIWLETSFYQIQLISCLYKAFFTDLTFNLYFKMNLLTSDLNFTV